MPGPNIRASLHEYGHVVPQGIRQLKTVREVRRSTARHVEGYGRRRRAHDVLRKTYFRKIGLLQERPVFLRQVVPPVWRLVKGFPSQTRDRRRD